jgi:hypothetical protein
MWFYPALAGATAWVFGAFTWDLKQKLAVPVTDEDLDPTYVEPFWGAIGDPRTVAFAPTRGRFRSVQESTDELGAKVFLVDYGNGQKIRQYLDPRIVL